MKKLLLALSLCVAGNLHTYAQVTKTDEVKASLQNSNKDTVAWDYGGVLNIGANEGFLHNWAAGGELASFSVNGLFSGHLDRLMHSAIWSNNLDLTYGLNYLYSSGFTPRKTDDRIDFTSKFSRRLDTSNIFITGLFNFKSQFTKGYDYTIEGWDTIPSANTSNFFSPAYFTAAIGSEFRKGTDVSIFLSPAAARLTFVDKKYTTGPQGAYGVKQNETSQFQFGAYFSGRYVANINKRTVFKTRLDLYANYLAKDVKDSTGKVIKKDNPGNIDVLFDNLLTWKASKFLNITLGATFMYDNDIPYSKTYVDKSGVTQLKDDPGRDIGWLQIKQIFNIGLEYKF